MILSRYVSIFNNPFKSDTRVIFNLLSEEAILLKGVWLRYVEDGSTDLSPVEGLCPDLYRALVEGKYVVPEGTDELSRCLEVVKKRTSDPTVLRITVNPTLDCNLQCWYCYEEHMKGSIMDSVVVGRLEKFLRKKVTMGGYKALNLSFFGGEPLLKFKEVVLPIMQYTAELCQHNHTPFSIGFTSNGVCLTRDVVEKIIGVSREAYVQVAFDGGRDEHNKVKHFPNGVGAYDTVVSNIKVAVEMGMNVTVRCNYTLENLESFYTLVGDFKAYLTSENLYFSFHRVWQEEENDALHQKIKFVKELIMSDYKIRSNIENAFTMGIAPCYADYKDNVVVNYDGLVYKCTARPFVPTNSIGSIGEDGEVLWNELGRKRNAMAITQVCTECKLLPICNICSQRRFEMKGNRPCERAYSNEEIQQNIINYYEDKIRNVRS